MMVEYVVGIDLGGTQLRVALLDRDLNILKRKAVPTEAARGSDYTLGRMQDLVEEILPDVPDAYIAGIGISAPGPSNPNTGVIVSPPNLPGWYNVPIVNILQKRFGHSTYLGNDANVAALAETARGAARGFRNVIFITLSTGIGGGFICDGRLLLGKDGLAAEAGHMVMVVDGKVTTLEKEAQGLAIARQARERIEQGEKSLITDLLNSDLTQCTAKIVGKAAAQGDALALSIVRRAGWIVGLGVTSLLHLFNPEIIVFGGGVSKMGDLLFDPMREAIQQHALDSAYWQDLLIKPAQLGDNVSLIGAGALVVTKGGVENVAAVTQKLNEA